MNYINILKKLSVDTATWNPIWDLDLIARTSVDKVISMSTYTANFTTFANRLNMLIQKVSLDKLGIGLEVASASDSSKILSPEDVKMRFDLIIKYGIKEIDIWRTPIPEFWWTELRRYQNSY